MWKCFGSVLNIVFNFSNFMFSRAVYRRYQWPRGTCPGCLNFGELKSFILWIYTLLQVWTIGYPSCDGGITLGDVIFVSWLSCSELDVISLLNSCSMRLPVMSLYFRMLQKFHEISFYLFWVYLLYLEEFFSLFMTFTSFWVASWSSTQKLVLVATSSANIVLLNELSGLLF